MGKKARKTRWRALTITDEHSDSEESSTTTTQRLPKGYQQKSYYNKFSYSSQSTPRRRYQNDSTKSTRSSSTASENKITFNEDEYTRITTPRQDVLFKKGYLNKPKNYQTQTSTGTSTTSTGNSTGNGTPDHQSTDLEYESQFVFPNGFIDQNGIYYVNGYESYPLMLYNPPTYYPEFVNCKSKRYSTDSLTESMSPNNEEATSQDLSGGEASNNVSDYGAHHQLYNMVYPGYYVNGVCPPHEIMNGRCPADQTRKIKKRRRRRTSKSQAVQDSSEYTEDESDSCDEEKSKDHQILLQNPSNCHIKAEETAIVTEEKANTTEMKDIKLESKEKESSDANEETEDSTVKVSDEKKCTSSIVQEEKQDDCLKGKCSPEIQESTPEIPENPVSEENLQNGSSKCTASKISDLKPDAEEFIPRAYRNSEVTINSNLQFVKVPPNFVSIPLLPLGEFNGQSFSPAFIPPGIPINFLHPDPKLFPSFVSFVPNTFVPKNESEIEGNHLTNAGPVSKQTEQTEQTELSAKSNTAKNEKIHQNKESGDKSLPQNINSKTIDIATIVSKLEEAVKEQEDQDAMNTSKQLDGTQSSPRRKYFENKSKVNQKYKSYRRNYYYTPQNSPQKKNGHINGDTVALNGEKANENNKVDVSSNKEFTPEQKLETKDEVPRNVELLNGALPSETQKNVRESPKHIKNSPEKSKTTWKHQHYQNGSPKWHQNNAVKDFRNTPNSKFHNEPDIKDFRTKQNYKNYSDMLKNKTGQKSYEKCNNEKQKSNFEISKVESKIEKTVVLPPKQSNQWISVSNRKKRKNKNIEESEEREEKEEKFPTDSFETCNGNTLADISLTEDEIIEVETTESAVHESTENVIMEKRESSVNEQNSLTNSNDISVSDAKPQQIVKIDKVEPHNSTPELRNIPRDDATAVQEIRELPESEIFPTQIQATETKGKKKSKKGMQKPLTKRIIITDVDLSMNYEQIKTPIKKIVTKLNDTKTITERSEEKHDNKPKSVAVSESSNPNEDEEKKKSKKKKKKPNKVTVVNSSLSSSSTTINVVDDAYDFLLDSALSDESVEKTNIEVSQELDKLIQKGMYSSLEEKIKSLNIDESDGFFKSIFTRISSRESSVEKVGFTQTPDLSKILQNTRNLCTSCSVSQEHISQNRNINTILPDLDSPVEDGFFLEKADIKEVLQDQTATNDMDNEESNTEDSTQDCKAINEKTIPENELEPKFYPITQAVKEWMNKTREKTPDAVLLKSPSAIYREFCDSASEYDTEVTDSKNLSNSIIADDDEILIFRKGLGSRKGSVDQTDLLEYWENDLETCKVTNKYSDSCENKCLMEKKCPNNHVEEGEDVIEVYESKYGKNEDYLNLQKQVREQTNKSNYPNHGNLPYRAICCSIM